MVRSTKAEESDEDESEKGERDGGEEDKDKMDDEANSGQGEDSGQDEMSEDEGKKNEFTEMVKTQARPLARPSAAAAGFGTMGMSDKQVIDKVMENRQKPDEEDAESNASSSSQCGSPKSSTSSTTSSTSSGASSSDEDDTKDMKPNPAQKNVELEVKAGDREFRVREEFPKTNIRRWTTPGSRFEIPANLSSQEARLTAIKIQKQPKLENTCRTDAETDGNKTEDPPEKEKNGRHEQQGKKKKKANELKKGEEKSKDGGESPKAPRHRHRTKSARFLLA